jgi:hypothetical protein
MASYTDQFYAIDASAPPGVGTSVSVFSYTLTDQNNDGDVDRFNNDSVNGSDITSSYRGDTLTINVPGTGNVTYTGVTFYLANGQVVFTPNDGQVLENGTFVSSTWVSGQGSLLVSQLGPPCFAAGTRILTPSGERRIETLAVGDPVVTLDHGPQPIRWIGRRTVAGTGAFAPVRFATGSIGNTRPLVLSPQHRVLWQSARAELFYGAAAVLVPAMHLEGCPGVCRAPVARVTYLHLLFDRHEIVLSEGCPTESFHPGAAMIAADRALRSEIAAIFPACPGLEPRSVVPAARPVLAGYEARLLVA